MWRLPVVQLYLLISYSCELCKARKVKCDRNEPSCGWCTRNNRVCLYQDRKKPGLRVGYGKELEDKINRLEAIIQVLGRRVEDHISEHDSHPPLFHSPEFAIQQHAIRSGHPGAQATPMAEPRWSQSAHPEDRHQFSRPSDTMSIHSVVVNAPVGIMEDPTSSTPGQTWATTSSSIESELPPYDLLYSICDLYFKHVNVSLEKAGLCSAPICRMLSYSERAK